MTLSIGRSLLAGVGITVLGEVVTFTPVASARGAVAELKFVSDKGDYIGAGQTQDIIYDSGAGDSVSGSAGNLINGSPSEVSLYLLKPGANDDYSLEDFGTKQLGIPLSIGSYTNAERDAFAEPGHPGLDVSFAHRGSNTLTGSFTVDDIIYTNGKLQYFDASFVQHSEGNPAALTGTIVFSATALPEPTMITALGIAGGGVLLRRRRRQ